MTAATIATALHTAPVVVPMAGPPIADGAVAVAGDRIVAVGPVAELAEAHPHARVRRWDGVLTPGLVNAHAHLQYTDFADMAVDTDFVPWIRAVTTRRREFTPRMWQESARRGIHQLLSTGTTCVADIVTDPDVLLPTARSGIAGVSYVEVVGVDESRWPVERERLIGALDAAPRGRMVGVSPHALYTLSTLVAAEVGVVGRSRGLRLHPHAAETTDEAEYVLSGTGRFAEVNSRLGMEFDLGSNGGCGRTPVAQLDALGLLGPDVHVAHGVHVTATDRAVLRQRGTAVALCVRSNRLLRAGKAPVADYLAEGNPLAVGTDSLASSPSLDLLDEVRALRDLALSQGVPAEGLAERLFGLATVGGAAAMGLSGQCGVLAPGARADFAVFDVGERSASPYDDLVDRGRCVATVLGGRVVHRRAR